MITIHADMGETRAFSRALKRKAPKALRFATASFLNALAFHARQEWKEEIPRAMTVRTKGTVNRIGVNKTRPVSISAQAAAVGHMAAYMKTQELGESRNKRGKHGLPIPAAAAGGRNATRKKLSKKNYRDNLNLSQVGGGKGRRRRHQIAIAFAVAAKRGGSIEVFLELSPNRRGIYRLTSGHKRGRMKKIWDLSKASVTIPVNPTMVPAVRRAVKSHAGNEWTKAIRFQLKRALGTGNI